MRGNPPEVTPAPDSTKFCECGDPAEWKMFDHETGELIARVCSACAVYIPGRPEAI